MKPTIDPPDTVLDEIHETRRRLLQQHGGVSGLAAFLRERESKTDREIRTPEAPPGPNHGVQPTGVAGRRRVGTSRSVTGR